MNLFIMKRRVWNRQGADVVCKRTPPFRPWQVQLLELFYQRTLKFLHKIYWVECNICHGINLGVASLSAKIPLMWAQHFKWTYMLKCMILFCSVHYTYFIVSPHNQLKNITSLAIWPGYYAITTIHSHNNTHAYCKSCPSFGGWLYCLEAEA